MEEATEMHTTESGLEFTITGGRVVIPTPDHEFGGGIGLTEEDLSIILTNGDGGKNGQTVWSDTGRLEETRAGESRVLKITQESFGRIREITVNMVQLADADLQLTN